MLEKRRITLWVVILLVAISQPSDSKEVLSGDMLVFGQPGVLTIPHRLLSHIAPMAASNKSLSLLFPA